jgi:lipoprotein Spr
VFLFIIFFFNLNPDKNTSFLWSVTFIFLEIMNITCKKNKLKYLQLLQVILIVFFFISCSSNKKISNKKNDVKNNNEIVIKYAELLNTEKKKITNLKLYGFINDWYGTPYKYGGSNKLGIDCSGFVNLFYNEVFNKKIPRTVNDIYLNSIEINRNDINEGDFIFFKIESKKVSHIGIYLINDKFVHASTKKGIMISDLNEPYFKKNLFKFGRIK